MPQNKFSYDPDCEALAVAFLRDFPISTDEDKRELAQTIQTVIEDYLMKFEQSEPPLLPSY